MDRRGRNPPGCLLDCDRCEPPPPPPPPPSPRDETPRTLAVAVAVAVASPAVASPSRRDLSYPFTLVVRCGIELTRRRISPDGVRCLSSGAALSTAVCADDRAGVDADADTDVDVDVDATATATATATTVSDSVYVHR